MEVSVDEHQCCGAGMCTLTAPEVFDQSDEGIVVLLDARPPAAVQADVREAAHRCPCSAINVRESP